MALVEKTQMERWGYEVIGWLSRITTPVKSPARIDSASKTMRGEIASPEERKNGAIADFYDRDISSSR